MRKGIFIMLLVAIISQSCQSVSKGETTGSNENSVEQLFSDFSKEKGTERVNVGGLMMAFASKFTDSGVKDISGVEVYSFDDCEQDVKDRFNTAIKALKDTTYEELVSTSEGGERTKILVKISNDLIRELVVVTGGDDPALIRIKGKIKPEDVQSIVDSNK